MERFWIEEARYWHDRFETYSEEGSKTDFNEADDDSQRSVLQAQTRKLLQLCNAQKADCLKEAAAHAERRIKYENMAAAP
jgi:predicted transcriptional regulator